MSGIRDTLKHASIYSAAGILSRIAGFIMLPFYAHKLGAEGYGVIGMVDASLALLTSLLGYGCQAGIIRIFHEESGERKALAVSTGYWLALGAGALIVAVAMATSVPLSGFLFGDPDLYLLLCLALVSFLLDLSGQAAASILLIKRRSVTFSAISVLRLVIGLSLNILLIVILDWGLFGFFLSSAVTSALAFMVLQYICLRECGFGFDKAIARKIAAFQMPLIPSDLVSFASRQSERVILRFVEGISKVGVLEMGYKFSSLLQLLIHTPLMNSWHTERIRLAEEGFEGASKRIGEVATISLYFLSFGALLVAVSIGDVLVILTPENFWEAKAIARIECLTIVVTCMTQHCNFGYFLRKDTGAWAVLVSSTSVVKVALSIAFIVSMGILGAAYSALLVSIVVFVFALSGGQRRYRIEYKTRANLVICLVATGIFIFTELIGAPILSVSGQLAGGLAPWISGLAFDPGTMASVIEKLPYIIDAGFRVLIASSFVLVAPLALPSLQQRVAAWRAAR